MSAAENISVCGCAFWAREKVYHRPHLHFLISYPEDDNGWAVVVGVTSHDQWRAADFVLRTGDHPAIKSNCVLSYASIKLANVESLSRAYREVPKLVWAERKAADELIARIQDVLIDSGRLERHHRDLVERARQRNRVKDEEPSV